MDAPIESLFNPGPMSARWLREAGIATIVDWKQLGPIGVWRLVKQQPRASLNLLWASAAGLEAKDWRKLTEVTRKRLRRAEEEQ